MMRLLASLAALLVAAKVAQAVLRFALVIGGLLLVARVAQANGHAEISSAIYFVLDTCKGIAVELFRQAVA
jgi:hypothetical protein